MITTTLRCLVIFLIVWLVASFAPHDAAAATVRVVTVRGAVNPVTSSYLARNLADASRSGDSLFLMEMDTPGGLDSAMREIVKGVMASPVPVAVFVSPSGARAASAGAVIALAADVCAMAPGTNIGAAHPVSLGEKQDRVMEEKVLNDAEAYVEGIATRRGRNADVARRMVRESLSLPAERALAEKVVDLVAVDRRELLRKLDGWRVVRGERTMVLSLAGATVREAAMGPRERVLDVIGNPNVAYILLMLGFLGIFFELSNPGVILPGVIGGISLLLAFFALQTLPVNYAGVLLILLALILFIAEIKIVSHGMLTVGGVIAMVLGSLLLFESPEPYLRVSWQVILVTVAAVSAFSVFAVTMAVRAHRKKPATGREGLQGETGSALTPLAPEGRVFIHGEYWNAWSDEPVAEGERVTVLAVEGMRLKVRRAGIGE
ncbi:NfeD family protein [Geobacter pickeringii]|uniref:Serine protease n=1 Tax=Geobacter pickeringii TaxID=345632 RepID=A0A0B5BIT1_9BACT|nr:nodulation protein NfeD [Geobacter pickeringii]AJE03956.1 serine protease [Geobacter pickeringii]